MCEAKRLMPEPSSQSRRFYWNRASLQDDRATLDDSPIKGFRQVNDGAGAGHESSETILAYVPQVVRLKSMVDVVHLQECRLENFWVDSHKIGRHRVMQSSVSYSLSNIHDPLPFFSQKYWILNLGSHAC